MPTRYIAQVLKTSRQRIHQQGLVILKRNIIPAIVGRRQERYPDSLAGGSIIQSDVPLMILKKGRMQLKVRLKQRDKLGRKSL